MAKLYLIEVRDRGQDTPRPTGQWYWSVEDQVAAATRLFQTGRYNSVIVLPPMEVALPAGSKYSDS